METRRAETRLRGSVAPSGAMRAQPLLCSGAPGLVFMSVEFRLLRAGISALKGLHWQR